MRIVNQRLQSLLTQRAIDVGQPGGNCVVENHAADGCVNNSAHIFLNRTAQDVLCVMLLGKID